MLVTFDSVEEFAKACKPIKNVYDRHGGLRYDETIERAIHGDESYVSRAEKLISQLDVAVPETKAFKVVHSPYGGRVNMGDWLAGTPTPMRRRVRSNSEYAPIKIVVSTTTSAGISESTIEKRGCTILALLLKLQQVRPIQLYLLTELHGRTDGWHYQLVRIESQPLAIGVAAFALCNAAYQRHLTFQYAQHFDNFNGFWPNDYYSSGYSERRAERLGLTEQDLVIKEAHIFDDLVQEPLKWLQAQLAKYTHAEGE